MIREKRYYAPVNWRTVAIWCAMALLAFGTIALWAVAADVPIERWFR